MISWIQRTFQQHFKWLFILLLGAVIISFVLMSNASSGIGDGRARRQPPRPFLGIDLAQAEDMRRLDLDGQLSIYLRFAPQRELAPEQIRQYALLRHATLHLADQLGLPTPTDEQLVAHIRTLRAFANPATREFDPKLYADFGDDLRKNPRGFTEGDASRVIAEDARAAAYEKLLAGPGYVLPSDVVEMLNRRDTVWTLSVATLDGSAYAPAIDTSDAALAAWFETNARRYEIPAAVSVAAITVPAAGFAAQVKLTDADVRAAYDANPARYPAPADVKAPEIKLDPATGKDLAADAAFAAVRPLVEADLRKDRAEKAALHAASDLAVTLLERDVKPDGLPAFLAGRADLALSEIGAVSARSIPAALGGPSASEVADEAARLSAARPYSNPVAIPAGAAILVWRENIPARVPALADVRDRAAADRLAAEKRRLFSEAGRAYQTAVAAAIAAGKSFDEAAKSAAPAGTKAEVKTFKPFSRAGQFPEDFDYSALQAIETLAKGKVSDFYPSGETTGVLVYALDAVAPAVDPASAAYLSVKGDIARSLGQANANALIAAFVDAELAKIAPVTE